MDPQDDVLVYFNPNCSKCRTARGILEERGLAADYVQYLEQAPSREELERVLGLLGADDPRTIVRTGEDVYRELGLAGAGRDALLDAMAANPILIERPIVIRGDRAVISTGLSGLCRVGRRSLRRPPTGTANSQAGPGPARRTVAPSRFDQRKHLGHPSRRA